MDFETLCEVGVDMQVQLVQESCFSNVNETYDQFNQFVTNTHMKIAKFVNSNQIMIKDIYKKIKGPAGRIEIPDVIDVCYALGSYKEYIQSMYRYINDILCGSNSEANIGMSLREMQEKDKTFFNSSVAPATEIASDAMKNIEALIDLKTFLSNVMDMAKNILSADVDNCLKKDLLTLFSKSVMTFYLHAMDVVQNTFIKIVAKIDSGRELKLESVRPYKYF